MYTVKIKPDILEHRLDCGFYNPVGLSATEKLHSTVEVKKLSELVDQKRKITNGVRGPEWASSAYKLIRLQDCNDWIVNSDDAASISKNQFEENRRCKLRVNDIVVAIGGYIGNAAVVVNQCEAVIGQHSAVLPEPEQVSADSRFLVAYLNSKFAEAIFSRYVSGTVQAGINLEDLRDLPAPSPNSTAQKYIGDKVRQAERLRAWAKASIAIADSMIADKFQHKLASSMTHCPRRLPTTLLSTISLGPEFARATEGQETFEASSPLINFTEFCKCGDPIRSEDRVFGIYPYYGASGPIDVHDEYNFDGEFLIVAQDGSIGCANIARGKIWANNHVWVVKIKSDYDPDAICRFLAMHFPYWKGVTTGSVVPKVTSENLLDIKVPDSIATDTEIGDYLRSADIAVRCSMNLTNAAKLLVEALIEGQLTEAELIAAEQALQAGNDYFDRRILTRLKTDGIDGQGAMLFADLDELYHLLTQAEGD